MRRSIVTAILAVLTAVPVFAQSNRQDAIQHLWETRAPGYTDDLGTFVPGLTVGFQGGLTDIHNSYGVGIGADIALMRFGRLRFPTVGLDAGIMSKCPPYGTDMDCSSGLFLGASGGLDFTLDRTTDGYGALGEKAIRLALTRVLSGPVAGPQGWGLTVGMAFRWRPNR